MTNLGVISNKSFWRTTRIFWTNEGILIANEISLINKVSTKGDEKPVAKSFNNVYTNVVEQTFGNKPNSVWKNFLYKYQLLIESRLDY